LCAFEEFRFSIHCHGVELAPQFSLLGVTLALKP
jgi:hypothetical protein